MKIAIEILSTREEPSTTNIQAMKDTFVSLSNTIKLENTYDFYFYYGGYSLNEIENDFVVEKDDMYENCYSIKIPIEESIYNTFEKTIPVFEKITGYDWYIRINISCYLNILLLDKILMQLDKNTVYCNAINSYINDERYFNNIYPRGDMIIFSDETRKGIVEHSKKYIRCDIALEDRISIPHVDDCLIGLCLIDYFGKTYYEHLQMLEYNFLPEPNETFNIVNFNKDTLASRVKTLPPGIGYSGYSWKNNDYRKFDAKKMKFINNIVLKYKNTYNSINIKNLFSYKRNTLFVSLSQKDILYFNQYLNNRKYKK